MDYAGLNDGPLGGLWAYFAPPGIATQWYWPPGARGCLWRLFHPRFPASGCTCLLHELATLVRGMFASAGHEVAHVIEWLERHHL